MLRVEMMEKKVIECEVQNKKESTYNSVKKIHL